LHRPTIPGIADAVTPSVTTLTPLDYRDPGQLPDGGALIVGASATGVQLAREIHRSGRPMIPPMPSARPVAQFGAAESPLLSKAA